MTIQQIKYAVTVAECCSMNKAANELFISQPSLSGAIKDLEEEIGIDIFIRNNRGVTVTIEGNKFLAYGRQLLEQYQMISEEYIEKKAGKKKFSVSMQHYSFAVKAFVEVVKQLDMEEYELAVIETKTFEVIENVKNYISEIGVLFVNEFNDKVLNKYFKDNNLEFVKLFDCNTYVYLSKNHPLANYEIITLDDLEDYPCLSFEQGKNNSFYLAEEVLSDYQYKRVIKANDRATMLNLMVGLDGYTLCSGIISEDLNGNDYRAVPLEADEIMTIGYAKKKGMSLSLIAKLYIEELLKYKKLVLPSKDELE